MDGCRIRMTPHSIIPGTYSGGKSKGEKEQDAPLAESLGLGAREAISLVGAGGKTTLMFRLARELANQKKTVLTTTTTRILEPHADEIPVLFIHPDEDKIKQYVHDHLDQYRHITLATERLESGKLKGISPHLAVALWNSVAIDYLIVEADGARGLSVKAPREGEPVIPENSTLVVGILGVDGVGVELGEERVCGAEQVSRLTGIPMGAEITDQAMAVLMTDRQGILRGAPSSSRVVALLNKVDIPNGLTKARRIAQDILGKKGLRIERVVLARLKMEFPIAEVHLI